MSLLEPQAGEWAVLRRGGLVSTPTSRSSWIGFKDTFPQQNQTHTKSALSSLEPLHVCLLEKVLFLSFNLS